MKREKNNQRPSPNGPWRGLLTGGLLGVMLLGSSLAFADPALRYERVSNRVERRDVRSGNRIDRRDERINNRIDRRDMLFSPPAGATAVSVGGVRGYQVGSDVYKPAIYEGQTVYVRADGD